MSDDKHDGCRVCGRTDVGLKRDGTLRQHVHAKLKGSSFLKPGGSRCDGAGHPPKGVIGRYAAATIEVLRPEFPDLERPHIAQVIGEAIQQQRVTPSASFECLLDEVGNWRLRADTLLGAGAWVRLACYRFNERDEDRARVSRINLALGEVRR